MLTVLKRLCLCGLILFCSTFTQGEEQQKTSNGWAARPVGKYEFLQAPIESGKEEAIRQTLPFRRIKLKRMSPGGMSASGKGFPAVIYYIEFHVDGKALLHAISGLDRNGVYTGKISLTDFARLCLLYETLITEAGDPAKFGYEIQASHPVISELTLTFNESKSARVHRNDLNFGDFKFWVFENVFENIESRVKWDKTE
ncbi:hypothetical protein [Gimesia maris]|uniref:hypothetical protein n=1 Tax=Gimesia maris TaxID=122 RepID=UPI0012B87C51|nr:hypothetical protein [Gimesia maris]